MGGLSWTRKRGLLARSALKRKVRKWTEVMESLARDLREKFSFSNC